MANVNVKPRRNDTPEKVIRRFIKKTKKAGIVQEVRRRRYYEKPSNAKRRKQNERKRTIERLKRKERTNYRSKR